MGDVCVSEFALGDGGGIVASQLTDLRFEQQLEEAAGKTFLCVLITGHVFVAQPCHLRTSNMALSPVCSHIWSNICIDRFHSIFHNRQKGHVMWILTNQQRAW